MTNQEYNTSRPKLKINNYGRNIAKLIDYAIGIENREERNALANTIIDVMAGVNPTVKEHEDYKHILWDHLMIMSDFRLDVDCPYEVSPDHTIEFKPNAMRYKRGNIRYRHYGRSIKGMIAKAVEMPEGEERDALVKQIVFTMKRFYVIWNRDSVEDTVILKQLLEMSEGKLSLPEGVVLPSTASILDTAAVATWTVEKKKKKKKK